MHAHVSWNGLEVHDIGAMACHWRRKSRVGRRPDRMTWECNESAMHESDNAMRVQWECIGNQWNPWKCNGHALEFNEIHVNAMEINEIHGNPWKCNGNQWNPWKCNGIPWTSLEIHRNQWEINEKPWKSMSMQWHAFFSGNQWKSARDENGQHFPPPRGQKHKEKRQPHHHHRRDKRKENKRRADAPRAWAMLKAE